MKKLLTFLMMSILAIGVGWAATSSLVFTAACGGSGTANDGVVWAVTSDADESTFDNTRGIHYGTSSKAVSYLNLTTSGISGTITQIKVNASGASQTTAKCNVTVAGTAFGSEVSLTSSATEYTFTGNASGEIVVSLTQTSAKKALYVKSIVVTYDDGGTTLEQVETPKFSVQAGHYTTAQNVTITCATADADIYWGTDGVNFASYEDEPILVNETMTLYAYAMKSGMDDSDVASAKYYIEDPAQPGDEVMFDYQNGAEFAQASNAEDLLPSSKQGITIDFVKNTGTQPKWYNSGGGSARVYANNTIVVDAGELRIETVTFTYDDGTNVLVSPSVNPGSWSAPEWTVNATNGTLTVDQKSFISTITVKLAEAGVIIVTPPTITGKESFVGSTEVTITAEEGATIYYTTNDEDPTASSTLYTAPFTINETTTVKAIAVIGDNVSNVTSKTFTAVPSVMTVAEFNNLTDNTNIGFAGTLVAVAQKGKYLYAQDNEKGILIYGSIEPTYSLGNVIPSGFIGTKVTYNGAPEMSNPTGLTDASQSVEVNPIEITPSQVNLDNFGRYAVIKGATISNGKIFVGTEQVTCYTNTLGITVPDDYEGKTYNITGVCGYYNAAQFLPLKFDEVTVPEGPSYYLVGSFNMDGENWILQDPDYKFNKRASGGYYLNDVEFEDANVTFKIIKVEDGQTTWYGGRNDTRTINGSNHSNINLVEGDAGVDFIMATAGINDFEISSDMTLNINRDAQLYFRNSLDWSDDIKMHLVNGSWTTDWELSSANVEFGFADEWNTWYGGDGWWVTSGLIGEQLDLDGGDPFLMVDAGNYTLTVNSEKTKLVVTKELVAHNITVASGIEHGAVTTYVDNEIATTAYAGDVVTVAVNPAEGYILDAISVMAGETPVTVTGNTFVMPDAEVTVSGTFKLFVAASYFKLVTAMNQLEAGKQILIVGVKDEDVYVMSSAASSGNNMTSQAVASVSAVPPTYIINSEGFNVFVLGTSGDNYTMTEGTSGLYLQATSSSSNRLGVGEYNNNATATFALTDGGTFEIVFQGNYTRRNLRYNSVNNLFSCYQSGQEPVYLYVETDETPTYPLQGVSFINKEREWATWFGNDDLALPENVTAYVVTGFSTNNNGTAVEVEEIGYIPSGVAVLLHSTTTASNLTAEIYTGTLSDDIEGGPLKGDDVEQTVEDAAYVLYNNQFVLLQEGTTVGAHRCYMLASELEAAGEPSGAPVLRIAMPGTVTGIDDLRYDSNGKAVGYYDLTGRYIGTSLNGKRGIFITSDGKKVVK